eukprot:COSAG02_NODE_16_length_56207_cov_9.816122_13_plen_245_part_00
MARPSLRFVRTARAARLPESASAVAPALLAGDHDRQGTDAAGGRVRGVGAEDGSRLRGARVRRAPGHPAACPGAWLSPEQRGARDRTAPSPARSLYGLISRLHSCLHQDLGIKLADANIGETMEYDEYLLLVKQLGKRPDKSAEVRELKGAIAMVTKDKEYISASTQMCRRSAAGRRSHSADPNRRADNNRVPVADIDDIARVMSVIGEATGEALNEDELEDFKQQIGSEEMKIDDFVSMLIDV